MKPANVKRAIGIYLACINLGFLGIAIKLSSGIGIAIGIGAVIWAVVAFRHALFGTGPAESEAPEQPGQPNAGKTSPLAVVLLAMPATKGLREQRLQLKRESRYPNAVLFSNKR